MTLRCSQQRPNYFFGASACITWPPHLLEYCASYRKYKTGYRSWKLRSLFIDAANILVYIDGNSESKEKSRLRYSIYTQIWFAYRGNISEAVQRIHNDRMRAGSQSFLLARSHAGFAACIRKYAFVPFTQLLLKV